jgi:hypothetical protein
VKPMTWGPLQVIDKKTNRMVNDSYCLTAQAGDWTYYIASFHCGDTITYLLSKAIGQGRPNCIHLERGVEKASSAAKVAAVRAIKQLAQSDADSAASSPPIAPARSVS